MINRLFKQTALCIVLCLLLSNCVQPPVFKTEGHALIKSNYPIVAVNGKEIQNTYQLDLEAGENSMVIVYNSYQYDYICTFSWVAEAGTAYEVTDHEDQYPLTLYRWHRKNRYWAIRHDAVNPVKCEQKQRP